MGCPSESGPVACYWIIFNGTAKVCVMINYKPLLFIYFLLNKKKKGLKRQGGKKITGERKRTSGQKRKEKGKKKTRGQKGRGKGKGKKKTRGQMRGGRQNIIFEGDHCQFVDFRALRSLGTGCDDGTKMVLKNK